MATTVTFTVSAQNFTINTPQWDYTTEINVSLIHQALQPRGYGIWDNGSGNDYRVCSATWLLNATDTNTFRGIFTDITKGRGISFDLNLGTNSGFYPFGPDLGDSGTFQCKLIAMDSGPVLEEPWLWFSTTIEFVMETNPAYSLPSQITEGDITIGGISGLRYPPAMPQSAQNYGFATQLTNDGTAYTVDKTIGADEDTTILGMVCNQSKAAALIDHMVGTVRDANVNVTDNDNGYFFGQAAGEDNTYVCQWLDSKIVVNHSRFNEFNFGLTFYRVSTS